MLLCGFRTCSFVNSCSEKQKKCVLAGYLKEVNSMHALPRGHLLFWHPFFRVLFTMFTNMLILIIYFDNGMYYLVIICLEDDNRLRSSTRFMHKKGILFHIGEDILTICMKI